MAVRVEQPAPFSAGAAMGYGAAEAALKANPQLLQAYSETNRMRTAAAQAEMDRRQRAQLASQELAQRQTAQDYDRIQAGNSLEAQVGMRNADREADRQRLDAQVSVSARDVFQATAESARQTQAAELRAWVNQQDLTYQEGLRLKRMTEAVSTVASDTSLDPQTKADLLFQLKTGIDPLQKRAEAARAKQMQVQQQQAAEQQKFMDTMRTGTEAQRAQAFQSRLVPYPDPETGRQRMGWIDRNGDLKPLPEAKEPRGEDGEKMLHPDLGLTRREYLAERGKVVRETTQRVRKDGHANEIAALGHHINEALDSAGLPRTLPEFLTGLRGGATGRHQPPPEPPKPFDARDPKSMTDGQRVAVRQMEAGIRAVQKHPDLPDRQKERLVAMADGMLDMLQVWGSVEGIKDPEERARYARFEKALAEVPPPKKAGPPPTLLTAEAEGRGMPVTPRPPGQQPPPGWLQRNVVDPVASVVPDTPF